MSTIKIAGRKIDLAKDLPTPTDVRPSGVVELTARRIASIVGTDAPMPRVRDDEKTVEELAKADFHAYGFIRWDLAEEHTKEFWRSRIRAILAHLNARATTDEQVEDGFPPAPSTASEIPVLPYWAVEAGVEIFPHAGYQTYFARVYGKDNQGYWCGPDGWKRPGITEISYGDEPTRADAIRRVIELGPQPWMKGQKDPLSHPYMTHDVPGDDCITGLTRQLEVTTNCQETQAKLIVELEKRIAVLEAEFWGVRGRRLVTKEVTA